MKMNKTSSPTRASPSRKRGLANVSRGLARMGANGRCVSVAHHEPSRGDALHQVEPAPLRIDLDFGLHPRDRRGPCAVAVGLKAPEARDAGVAKWKHACST